MVAFNPFTWNLDSFDSEILAFQVAKITFDESASGAEHIDRSLLKVIEELKKSNIRYAVCRVPGDNYDLLQSLEINNFILVDGLITLETKLTENIFLIDRHIHQVEKADYKQLIDLSGEVFRGVTRYYHDSVIPTDKADEIYRRWMENSVHGKVADLVLVWREQDEVLGFLTLQKKGQIPLVAVSEKARGKGVGKKLLNAALATFQRWGIEDVVIETQLSNIAALRLYQSAGFKVTHSHLTFRWLNEGKKTR